MSQNTTDGASVNSVTTITFADMMDERKLTPYQFRQMWRAHKPEPLRELLRREELKRNRVVKEGATIGEILLHNGGIKR